MVRKSARFPLALLLAAILTLAGAPSAHAASSIESLDGITTTWPVHAEGTTDIAAQTGTIRVQPDTLTGVHLQAEAVTFELEWGRGYGVHPGRPFAEFIAEEGEDTVRVQDVDVRFERFQRDPLFVAFTEESPQAISLESKSDLVFTTAEDETVASVGPSPDAISARGTERLSFWHTIPGPSPHATGPGTVKMEGSFTLFAHDVTMHVDAADESWSRWTGYWESDPGQPFTEFELRLTTIHVENGTFVAYAQRTVDLFSPAMDATVAGAIETQGVTGRLLGSKEIFLFDRDSMRLEGTGNIHFSAASQRPGSSGLLMTPEGDFSVQGAGTVETVEQRTGPFGGSGFLVPLVGLLAAVILAVGFIAYRSTPALATAYRNRRSDRWVQRARSAYAQDRLQDASKCYEKAVGAKPDDAFAWYKWAQTELELGNGAAAEQIAAKAQNVDGMDPLDLLDLRANAAWQRQDLEALETFLMQLASDSPGHAWNFLNDFGISPAVFGTRLRRELGEPDLKEGLEGYA